VWQGVCLAPDTGHQKWNVRFGADLVCFTPERRRFRRAQKESPFDPTRTLAVLRKVGDIRILALDSLPPTFEYL
jgi:hypothetical protein